MIQVLGVCVALWFVRTLLVRFIAPPQALAVAVLAVPTILATVIAAGALWPRFDDLFTAGGKRVSNAVAAYEGGSQVGADTAFFAWASQRMPIHATYYFIGNSYAALWAHYALLPRDAVSSIAAAQWLVFSNEPPTAAGPAGSFFLHPMIYAAGLAIERRR